MVQTKPKSGYGVETRIQEASWVVSKEAYISKEICIYVKSFVMSGAAENAAGNCVAVEI